MRRFRDLWPEPGMAPPIGRAFASLEAVRVRTILQIDGLDADQIAWSPARPVNSVGTLLTHIAESEAFWLVERIGARPLPSTRREIYRMEIFGRSGAPPAPRAPASYFLGMLSDLRTETRSILAEMAEADLEGKRVWIDPERDGAQEVFSVRWILDHVAVHEAHHCGQIALLRRLLGVPPAPPIPALPEG